MSQPTEMQPKLSLEIQTQGDATILRCRGKLISGTTTLLQAEVKGLMAHTKHIILDLTDLVMMDSMGLGTIASLYVSAKTSGCQLELINLSQKIRLLFSVTNMLSLFEVCGENNIRIP